MSIRISLLIFSIISSVLLSFPSGVCSISTRIIVPTPVVLSRATSTIPNLPSKPLVETDRTKLILPWLTNGMKNGIASGLATIIAKIIMQPFDTIKTIQQLQKVKMNMLETTKDIISRRGVEGLWSGTLISAFGAAPAVALYYSVYSTTRKQLTKIFPVRYRPLAIALAATMSNTIASVLRVPYEVYKQRLQAGQHGSLLATIKHSWQHEGLIGLYGNGKFLSQVIRDVPYALFTAVAYDQLQRFFQLQVYPRYLAYLEAKRQELLTGGAAGKSSSSVKNNLFFQFQDSLSGALAGGIGTFLTNPQDVIKTRLMVASHDASTSVAHVTQQIWAEEGITGFFSGSTSRLVHKIPGNGLFFLLYEGFRYMLGAVNLHSEQ